MKQYNPDDPTSPTNPDPIYPCPPGYHRDKKGPYGSECVPDTAVNTDCPAGQTYSSMRQRCEDDCPGYQTRDGSGNCIDFGDPHDPKNQKPATSGSGGGSALPKPADLNPNFSSQSIWDRTSSLWDSLLAQGNNLKPRWNSDNTALVKGQLRQATAGNAAAEKKALMAQRAASGMLTQGTTQRQLRGIGERANTNYASGATGIDVRAAGENFEDQMAILNKKSQDIQAYGAFQLSLAGSDQAAASIRNSMSIALAQIQQQKEALQKQLDMQKYLAQLGLAGNLFGTSA